MPHANRLPPRRPVTLRGRRDERAALDRLLQRTRGGEGSVLVLRGEAGIGKTVLLEHVAERAGEQGFQVERAVGVQSEMELAFAALHQLCAPLLDRAGALPAPQQQALRGAFGLQGGAAPNRFLVAVGALSLLAAAAETKPLACVVDDAQWLDRASAQVLAFVARRLLAEPIAMIFAVREPSVADELPGLPQMRVEGLDATDARALLDSVVPGRIDARVRDRILVETHGNPLALLELPRGLTPAELAGGFAPSDARPLASRIEQAFRERVAALPREARRLLLAAAAEPLGDTGLLWSAADLLGVGAEAAGPAEADGLIELGARVRFTHPLVRSAVYRAADPRERREVHAALAEATDAQLDPDRRAWHRAQATATPEEAVAAELVRSAGRAQRRSGVAAAAAFLERAAELTPDPGVRVERLLDAAEAKLDVAAFDAAQELLDAAEIGPLDQLRRARAERLGAQLAFARQRGRDAPPLLLDAARRLTPLDAAAARETYLEALAAAMFAGRLGSGPDEHEIAAAARASLPAGSARPADALLDALAIRLTEGYAAGVEPLAQALGCFRGPDGGGEDQRWTWLACRLAQEIWDDELWCEIATHGMQIARDTGALNLLPVMVNYRAAFDVHAGSFATAEALIDEVAAITHATGLPPLLYAHGMLISARGDLAQARELFELAWQNATERGEGSALGQNGWMSAVLHNGNGRYGDALAGARQACEREDVLSYGRALAELVEAAVRSGRPQEAGEALERLRVRTQAAGTAWALGVEARCRALVEDDEAGYRESIERLAQSRAAVELARSRLLYGEWLRRANRRTDAREPLRAAHADFSRFGAAAFAERARRELLATGETVQKAAADARSALTPQEVQVARLARDGLTNPEIGAQLFISPRTVEYHLRKVFRKLDVSTRRELGDGLAEQLA